MNTDKLRTQIGLMLEELPESAHPVDAGTFVGSIGLDEHGLEDDVVRRIVLEEAAKRDIPVGKA